MIDKLQKRIFWVVMLIPLAVFFIMLIVSDASDIYFMYNDIANKFSPSEWRTYLRTYLISTITSSVVSLIVAALLLAWVARYISRRITRPVEESIAKQNRFIADASHELKTPVSVINANIDVLERTYGENKWMQYIKEEGHSMTLLINQLLNLSRLDYETSEKKTVAKPQEQFMVVEALTEATLPFDSIAFEKHAMINIGCDEETSVPGSRNDFKEIISILVDNAIKHTDDGGEITVSTKNSHALRGGDNKVTVAVSNTGAGIHPDDLPHIFDRFYKGSRGESKTGCNFGLGLSIAKTLAEKNGYSISVESRNGETTFVISVQ